MCYCNVWKQSIESVALHLANYFHFSHFVYIVDHLAEWCRYNGLSTSECYQYLCAICSVLTQYICTHGICLLDLSPVRWQLLASYIYRARLLSPICPEVTSTPLRNRNVMGFRLEGARPQQWRCQTRRRWLWSVDCSPAEPKNRRVQCVLYTILLNWCRYDIHKHWLNVKSIRD